MLKWQMWTEFLLYASGQNNTDYKMKYFFLLNVWNKKKMYNFLQYTQFQSIDNFSHQFQVWI